MFEGYSQIFWGIFITTFNIKFGTVKILLVFVGLLLVSNGLRKLYEETKIESFHKAQKIGLLATAMSFIAGILDYFYNGLINHSIFMLIWMVLYQLLELILFFKTLESSIEYLAYNNYPDAANENTQKLKSYTIISIINIVLLNFTFLFNINVLMFFVPIIGIILKIFMMVLIHRLKKIFMKAENSL
ncbi:hypothetical protein EV204_10793 [Tissierella praeacuta]|uniref:hypothetical protein n=1 Tax=Tissierella praeacuta TaxID=43131 RepID=UPI001051B6CB|nr:hypothetical protein [Tissierella praeacuta]TCU70665.1 hypothetical protein EV204_10793 [Tissierella praeacuta]